MATEWNRDEFLSAFGEGHKVPTSIRSPKAKGWLDEAANAHYYIDFLASCVVFSDEADAIAFSIYVGV